MTKHKAKDFSAVELFAGVGGFRIGLQEAGWKIAWSNQYEPSTPSRQHASDCYVKNFGPDGHVCQDISSVLLKTPEIIPANFELLVGGFPCQDYSVAKPLTQSSGINGTKGALWWSIFQILTLRRPPFVLLENVDRLLKSPSTQRGRDFAIMLSCFAELGYTVEWRVVNAADYGFSQRRRRVFIYAQLNQKIDDDWNPQSQLSNLGVMARALPVHPIDQPSFSGHSRPWRQHPDVEIPGDRYSVSVNFGIGARRTPFANGGIMINRQVWTANLRPKFDGKRMTLGDVVRNTEFVDEKYFLSPESEAAWAKLKGAKSELRVNKITGFEYLYSEGAIAFPDSLDQPSRTILTGEIGSSPSRFKHVIRDPLTHRLRRLIPEELEQLNGFDRGWTETGMPLGKRGFMMGNALVVGIVEKIAKVILADAANSPKLTPSK